MSTNKIKLADWPLPAFGIGTGMWRLAANTLSPAEVKDLTTYVLSGGKAFFDTAPRYGSGYSEEALGTALEDVPRERYILASKTNFSPKSASDPTLLRDQLLRSVEESLKRLKTDHLDILQLHDPDCCLEEALTTAFPALLELRDQGLTRAIGAGMNQWEMLGQFAEQVDVDCFLLAGRYTLLEQGALPLLRVCEEKGIALFLGGVYNTGILSTGSVPGAMHNYRPASPAVLERVRRIEAACANYNISLRAAAIQFAMAGPGVRSLVIGVRTVEEYQEALDASAIPIPASFWEELRAAEIITSDVPTPGNAGSPLTEPEG